MANVFFISDLHIGHEHASRERGFDSVEEMHVALEDNWNKVVRREDDVVWVLGDVVWDEQYLPVLGRLNGRKKVVLGNHDKNVDFDKLNYYCDEVHGVIKKYHNLVMSHVPIHPSCLEYNWEYNIHGHIHFPAKTPIDDNRYINVNVDVIGMAPVDLNFIRERVKRVKVLEMLKKVT